MATPLDTLRLILHGIADLLAWPVMVGLLLAAALTLIAVGQCLRQGLTRRRPDAGLEHLDRAAREAGDTPLSLRLERILVEAEHRQWRAVTRLRGHGQRNGRQQEASETACCRDGFHGRALPVQLGQPSSCRQGTNVE